MKARTRFALGLCAALLAAGAAHAGTKQPYRLEDLGESTPLAANDRGGVVGFQAEVGKVFGHATRWMDGSLALLSDLGFGSRAQAIADDGSAAGFVLDAAGDYQVVRWAPDGTRTAVGVVGLVSAMNRAGTIVGQSRDAGFHQVGWQLDAQGTYTALPPLPGDTDDVPLAINVQGVVVGFSYQESSGLYRCAIWHDGVPTDLGLPEGASDCVAQGINSAGHIVGWIRDARLYYVGFVWQNGKWTILGPLGGFDSQANAINDDGVVVGMANVRRHHINQHAFVWKDGVMTDLNQSFHLQNYVNLDEAVAIDSHGRVFVGAHWPPHTSHYFEHTVMMVPNAP
jgi:probable HAF family extracellular repeat protein